VQVSVPHLSVVSVGGVNCGDPALQVVSGVHTRSDVGVGARVWNLSLVQTVYLGPSNSRAAKHKETQGATKDAGLNVRLLKIVMGKGAV
jgi:hypothetical protein